MPAKPLIDHVSICRLLDEMAELGFSSAEVDIMLVRQGAVDLDVLQECKRDHPVFSRASARKRRLLRIKR